jgi:arsenate reductase
MTPAGGFSKRTLPERKRVLFVCIGNACRSQMAEAFARRYGSDVLTAASAGLMPASSVPRLTHDVMREKNIALEGHYPKSLGDMDGQFDRVVNMSGAKLPPGLGSEIEEWVVQDPMGEDVEVFRAVRDEIEHRVMRLVLTLRMQQPENAPRRRRI